MKKIIKNKIYNTQTAECVGGWDNGGCPSDFNYCAESLYRKKTGEFFLHGEGGAMSKYATSRGNNSWGSGEKIIPLTYESAQRWAEQYLDGKKYEEIFGEIVEGESWTTITMSISAAVAEKAKRAAEQTDMPLSAYIESLITAGLDKVDSGKGHNHGL